MNVRSLSRPDFLARFGGVFEHSAWIAERAFDRGLPQDCTTAEALHAAMIGVMRGASQDAKLALIRAHPDLAGRLAKAERLTGQSQNEQASAGLDRLTDAERARFIGLNEAYKGKFGFPFILAVRGRTKAEILDAFERRLRNRPDAEFETALAEIEKIALLRLQSILATKPPAPGAPVV